MSCFLSENRFPLFRKHSKDLFSLFAFAPDRKLRLALVYEAPDSIGRSQAGRPPAPPKRNWTSIMKNETPRPIRLKDYKPPNFLIDTVALDVLLDPTHTRVKSRLKMRPNPAAGDGKRRLRL